MNNVFYTRTTYGGRCNDSDDKLVVTFFLLRIQGGACGPSHQVLSPRWTYLWSCLIFPTFHSLFYLGMLFFYSFFQENAYSMSCFSFFISWCIMDTISKWKCTQDLEQDLRLRPCSTKLDFISRFGKNLDHYLSLHQIWIIPSTKLSAFKLYLK